MNNKERYYYGSLKLILNIFPGNFIYFSPPHTEGRDSVVGIATR